MEGEDDDDQGEHDDDHAHAEVPHEYEDLVNPFDGDADALEAGGELFAVSCASCHGDEGMGDGPAAAALDPMPASLADSSMMSELSDAYIFWRITEGGIEEPFSSAMPPWGETFTEEQRWQLVSFIRSLAQ
jgi:mono/diheme cytochrome c family protein